jgi:hypothetical protein
MFKNVLGVNCGPTLGGPKSSGVTFRRTHAQVFLAKGVPFGFFQKMKKSIFFLFEPWDLLGLLI